jgi:signal transduction histidine kinase
VDEEIMGESYSDEAVAAAGGPRGLKVYGAVERVDLLGLVSETLRSTLPGSEISFGSAAFPAGRLPDADCVVLDVTVGGVPALEAARSLRMAGYEGGIVLLAPERSSEAVIERTPEPEDRTAERAAARSSGPVSLRLAAMGVSRTVAYENIAGELPFAVVSASIGAGEGPVEAARRELRAAQRLNAIGDLAASVQHAANNPLTAILAEAQLLEMEPLAPEHREALRRIVELSRRLAAIIRRLDLPRAR